MTAEPTADESERLAEPALPELPALGRKMSFTSAAMVNGAFPPAMSMCEPIINVVMRFEGGTAPALADVVEQAQSLLVFERLRTVPKRVGGSYSFVAPETPAGSGTIPASSLTVSKTDETRPSRTASSSEPRDASAITMHGVGSMQAP